jgi:hypothetical protein
VVLWAADLVVVEQEVAVSIRAATTSRKSIFFIGVLLGWKF